MKKWFKKLAVTCAIIPLAQCAMLPGGNIAMAAEPVATTLAEATAADPALWVVKDEDTTIYLFGTVHVLKPGLSWFDTAIQKAFDSSDQLMLELVLPEDQAEVMKTTMPLAIDQSGTPLSSRLSEDERTAYLATMQRFGLPAAQFDMFKPWFAGMTLSIVPLTALGFDPEEGVEKMLTRFAKNSGKPVAGLETLEEQLGFFDSLSETAQLGFLNAVVRDVDKMGPMLDRLVELWAKGDPDGLAALMNESMATSPELAAALLYDRNARWAEQLKARMDQPGTVFVAVGAGHLAGEKSVQDYLKDHGLTATRVEY